MIPEGWSIVQFGSLTRKIGSGLTPLGGQKAYLDHGIPLIRSQNVLNGKLILDDVAYISDEQHQKMSNSLVHPNDVLLNITGASIGRCCTVPGDFTEGNVNQHVCIIRPSEKLDAAYLMSVLISSLGQKQIWQFQAGGNRQGLNFDQIRSFRLLLPPLPEQRAIAAILGTWDRAIALTERRLAAAEQRKQALMQQLLTGRVRFPEFAGEAWREVKVSEMGRVLTGNTPSKEKEKFYGGCLQWASPADIEYHYEVKTTKTTLSEEGRKVARIVPKGSVLVTCIGSIGKNAVAGVEMAFNQQINAVVVNRLFDNLFVYYLIDYYPEKLWRYAGTTSVAIINKSTFERVKYLVPSSFEEQRRIAAVLNACDRELELLRRKRDALQRQKRGLMQRLLTGRVRVGAMVQRAQGASAQG